MPRHKKGKKHVSRPDRDESSEVAAVTRKNQPKWRLPALLLILLVGLGAVLLVYGRDSSRFPNTIADGAAEATPEVAALLQEASEVVDQLAAQYPDSPDALDAIAWAHQRFGKTQEAVAYWERCLELEPDSAPTYHSLGLATQDAGDLAAAAQYFRRATDLEPSASRHATALGESLLNLGELKEAARVLEQDLAIHPNSAPSLILIGEVFKRLKQYEQSREYLEKAIKLAPDYTSAYYGLATVCAKLGDREKAEEYLEQFKILKARDEQAHRDLLKSTRDVGDVWTTVAEIRTSAGKVFLSHGEVATAEEYLLRAIDCDPGLAEPRQVLAWLYQKQDRHDEAVRELAALRKQAAGAPAVCLSLGEMYWQLGMFEEAEEAYQQLIEISHPQSCGYVALAQLYLQANRKVPEAIELAQEAVNLDPVAAHYHLLAMACQRAGDRAAALAAIREAVSLDPGNGEYRRLRELMGKE